MSSGSHPTHHVTLGVLFPLSLISSQPPGRDSRGKPCGVGMLSHVPLRSVSLTAGGHSAGSWARPRLGLWKQETGSEGRVIGSHEAVICSWSAVSKW